MESTTSLAVDATVPTFSVTDCELFVPRVDPKRPWKEVSEEEKGLASDLGARLKLAAESAAAPLQARLPVSVARSNFHLRGNAQRDLWGCVYPTVAGHKSYALQVAMIISRDGAEICCCLGTGSSSVQDAAKIEKYSAAWSGLKAGLSEVPPAVVAEVDAGIAGSELDFEFFRLWRDPTGGGDFDDFAQWLVHAASDQGAQASVSAFIPVEEIPTRGELLASYMLETAETFAPLFASAYSALAGAGAMAVSQPAAGQAPGSSPAIHKAAALEILQGPPGTGKTFRAKREAVRLIDGSVAADESASAERHAELVDADRIFWVTFHPSYSYEDFVEGFRPRLRDGQMVYEVVDGPFKRACEACEESSMEARMHRLAPGRKIGKGGKYEVREVFGDGVVLLSDVTRKDAVNSEREVFTDLWTIERFRERGISADDLSHPGQSQELRKAAAKRAGVSTTMLASAGHYRALYEHLLSEQSDQPRSVVLVIDEINRADLSRVFGELITLIEPDKRRGAPEESAIILPYSGKKFTVPAELSIVGTMNTADRSLAVLDVAFRRRFEFIDIEPDPALCPEDWGDIPVRKLLSAWNERLALLESRDARLGHSEFMAHRLDAIRVEKGWPDDVDGRQRAFAFVLRTKVLPLLLEYFHEDWRRADAVLGATGLIDSVDPSEETKELIEEYLALDEGSDFEIGSWWDPLSAAWAGEKFLVRLS